jgi:hypothetical protein
MNAEYTASHLGRVAPANGLLSGAQSQSGCCGDKKTAFPEPRVEPRFSGFRVRSLIYVLALIGFPQIDD